jgi:hypothetical protein
MGLQGEIRIGPADAEIKAVGPEDRSFEKIRPLADGGDHKALPGKAVFDFVKQTFHEQSRKAPLAGKADAA